MSGEIDLQSVVNTVSVATYIYKWFKTSPHIRQVLWKLKVNDSKRKVGSKMYNCSKPNVFVTCLVSSSEKDKSFKFAFCFTGKPLLCTTSGLFPSMTAGLFR